MRLVNVDPDELYIDVDGLDKCEKCGKTPWESFRINEKKYCKRCTWEFAKLHLDSIEEKKEK